MSDALERLYAVAREGCFLPAGVEAIRAVGAEIVSLRESLTVAEVKAALFEDAHKQVNLLQRLASEYLANDGSDGSPFDAMELARIRKELRAALGIVRAAQQPAGGAE